MIDRTLASPSLQSIVLTVGLLALGLAPLPSGWARTARETTRSLDRNRGDRSAGAGGYYEGLIGGEGQKDQGAPGPLALALVGDPIRENRDLVKRIIRDRKDDFLQFDLKPDHDEVFFGRRFTTNSHGMRDREYTREKPENVYRIALLGSSIDMGWGVDTPDTYENLLEDWLNAEATRRGLSRRFEILNFAVVAYGPTQRYDVFHHKALAFAPDLVLYSSTMLDPRLVEIHLGGLIKNHVDLQYDFFRQAVAEAGVDPDRERSRGWADLDRRGGFKARVKNHYWTFADAVLKTLAADCRSLDIPLATLLIPRACRDDANDARSLSAARHAGIAARHAVPLLDLSATFDPVASPEVEVTPGDDHPNTRGHQLLFEAMVRECQTNPSLGRLLLNNDH